MKGKVKVFGLIFLFLAFSVSFVLLAWNQSYAQSTKFSVEFEAYPSLGHVCFIDSITNLQDSNDNFPYKIILNNTNIDISEVEIKFWEEKPEEYNETIYEFVSQNCTDSGNGTIVCNDVYAPVNITRTRMIWLERNLVSKNENYLKGEISNQFEEVQIKKYSTKRFKRCYYFNGIPEIEDYWGSWGFTYIDVKNDIFSDFTNSSWWNTTCLTRQEIITNITIADMPFNINDTNLPNQWTNNRTELYHMYDCTYGITSFFPVANETDELNWENGTSLTGNNPTSVWDAAHKIVAHLDEGTGSVVNDSTSNNNDGTLAICTYTTDCIYGSCLFCDGTQDNGATITSNAGLQFNDELTISAWINVGTISGENNFLVAKGNFAAHATISWAMATIDGQADKIQCEYESSGGSATFGLRSNTSIADLQWYHVVCVFDNGVVSVYINGTSETGTAFGTNTSTFQATTQPVMIGREGRSDPSLVTNGTIDDVMIINVAKSADWVADVYNNGINNLTALSAIENLTINITVTISSPQNITYTTTSIDLNWSTDTTPNFVQYSLNGAANVSLKPNIINGTTKISATSSFQAFSMVEDAGFAWIGNATGITKVLLNGSDAGVYIENSCSGALWCGVHVNSTNVFLGNSTGVYLYNKSGILERIFTENITAGGFGITAITGNSTDVWVSNWNGAGKRFGNDSSFISEFSIGNGIDDLCLNDTFILVANVNDPEVRRYDEDFTQLNNYTKEDVFSSGDNGIICNSTNIIFGAYGSNTVFYSELTTKFINTTITAIEGQNNVTVWANSTTGSSNESTVQFFVDSINPIITIAEPQNITYCDSNPQLNFSFVETNPDSCWYSLNGTANITLASCSTNGTVLVSGEGGNNVRLCMNDTVGNEGCDQEFWTKDSTPPVITINNPINGTIGFGIIGFNFTFDEEIDTAVYSLNGTANVTNTTLSTFWIGDLGNLSGGSHNVSVWANDTCGETNETIRLFNVSTPPPPTIPQPGSVNFNQFLYNFSNPNVNEGATICWFLLNDNPATNYTCGTFNTTINTNIGENNLTLCWNNASGDFCNETLFNVSIRCSVDELNDTICGGNDFRYIIMCRQIGATVYQFDYGNMTFCEFGCIDGTCINRTFCKDNCQSGETMCNVNDIVTCKQKSNGCFDWSSDDRVHCDRGCQDGVCLGCQDMCNLGDATCDSPIIRFCDDDNGDGCLEFSNVNRTECEFGCTEALNLTTGFNNVTCNFHSFDDIYAIRSALTFGGTWFDYVFNTLNLKVWIVLIMMIGFGGIAGIKANRSYEEGWKVGLIIMAGIIFIASWIGWIPWVVTILFLIFVMGVWFSGRKE